jgi:hypothetical protein
MGNISTKWLLAVGLAACLLPGPAILAADKEDPKDEEKQEEKKTDEKQDHDEKAEKEKSEKEKEEGKLGKKGGRFLFARPNKQKPAQAQTAPQTQTAPSAAQTRATAEPPAQPGTRVINGFVQQIRKEQKSLVVRDNLTYHQVFFDPETIINRGGKAATFEQIEIMDQVLECRFNAKKRVLEIRLTPARKHYTPSLVPRPNPTPPPEAPPPSSPNK